MRKETFENCELYCGDCMDIMPKFPPDIADLVLTDLPFGEVNRISNGIRNLDKGVADIVNFDINHLTDLLDYVTDGSIYCFCGTEQVSFLRRNLIEKGLSTRIIVWEKTNPSPMNGEHIWLSGIELCVYGKKKNSVFNGHCKNTVLRFPVCNDKGRFHPTQKPIELMEHLLMVSSNKGDYVLDPFMGSGTTGVACVRNGRKFIGIELNEKYFDMACRRIEAETKQLKFDFEEVGQ